MTKRCKKCDAVKPLDEFHRWKKTKDGRRTVCKSCRSVEKRSPAARARAKAHYQRNNEALKAKQRVYNAANRATINAKMAAYRVAHPERVKAANRKSAHKNATRVKAYQASYHALHKDRLRANDKAYAAANRGKKNAYERKRRKVNPAWEKAKRHNRRARKAAGGTFTPGEWDALCNLYANACLACGRGDVKLTPDHVVPLVHGGSNRIENIQPLCLRCNIEKGTKRTDYRPTRQTTTEPG